MVNVNAYALETLENEHTNTLHFALCARGLMNDSAHSMVNGQGQSQRFLFLPFQFQPNCANFQLLPPHLHLSNAPPILARQEQEEAISQAGAYTQGCNLLRTSTTLLYTDIQRQTVERRRPLLAVGTVGHASLARPRRPLRHTPPSAPPPSPTAARLVQHTYRNPYDKSTSHHSGRVEDAHS